MFSIKADDPVFDGTETVTSTLKAAVDKHQVPPSTAASILNIGVTNYKESGEIYWQFEITAAESETLAEGNYVLDAKVDKDSIVTYTDPILLIILGKLTA